MIYLYDWSIGYAIVLTLIYVCYNLDEDKQYLPSEQHVKLLAASTADKTLSKLLSGARVLNDIWKITEQNTTALDDALRRLLISS